MEDSFFAKSLEKGRILMAGKLFIAGVGGMAFGLVIGVFMGSFDSTMSFGIDVRRSNWSQLRQHYFGHGRYLRRQMLHMGKFGFYIAAVESAFEIIVGKPNFLTMGLAGGLAAYLQNTKVAFWPAFIPSAFLLAVIGLY